MVHYVARRLLLLIPILFVVSVIIFGMSRLVPGDPALIMVGGHQTTPEVLENIREKYHLNKPVWEQYTIWLKNTLTGDLGESFKMKQSVSVMIGERLPLTLQLVFMSIVLTLAMAVPLGILAAMRKQTWVDYLSSLFALAGMSSPVFFTGVLLVLLFSFQLNWLPAFGAGKGFVDNLTHLLLPSFALAVNMIALIMRITRSGMIDVLSTNYMQTAIAKGLPRAIIILKHGMRNALIPLLTVTGLQIGFLMVGTVLVEYTFGLGGLGSLIINGVQTSDYPVVQGTILFMVVVFLLLNLLVDLLYAVIDPRIRYQ
ncbi:peptide ABC transporter permease [Brevibacillus reuszeri]|uniref:Peptide ABC transporter permease n=1 Tax=Brevibacillus reuszeri TaxID=54915 RepID=A0A0K9YPC3_9BACL|nr:peptide ABC transporter permease [Brevibacillus reuszeri]GED70000.1 peptide ABC transporter permease [Brevibacillus reuszeri]